MKKILILLATLIMIVSFAGCIAIIDDGDGGDSGDGGDTGNTGDSGELYEEDEEGNLEIINYAGERVVLYKGENLIKVVPDDSSPFLVNIENPDNERLDLRIYKFADVESDLENPTGDPFKTWQIVLADTTLLEDRRTWFVGSDAAIQTAGTLKLFYSVGGQEGISVDVHLNGRTGAKITSMEYGHEREIGIDYGLYTLHYHYWYSSQDDAGEPEDLGWIDELEVSEENVKIFFVLNDAYPEKTMQVPHRYADMSEYDVPYGNISIRNDEVTPIYIWVDNELIENVTYIDSGANPDELSVILAGDTMTYTLAVRDEPYTFKATSYTGGTAIVDNVEFNMVQDETFLWRVDGDDDDPPVISEISPVDGAVDYSVAGNIEVTFSETMIDLLTQNAFSIKDSSNVSVEGEFTWSSEIMTFDPTEDLAYGETYTITITTDASDEYGNKLEETFESTFTTESAN